MFDAASYIRTEIRKLEKHCVKWKLKISEPKTIYTIFFKVVFGQLEVPHSIFHDGTSSNLKDYLPQTNRQSKPFIHCGTPFFRRGLFFAFFLL